MGQFSGFSFRSEKGAHRCDGEIISLEARRCAQNVYDTNSKSCRPGVVVLRWSLGIFSHPVEKTKFSRSVPYDPPCVWHGHRRMVSVTLLSGQVCVHSSLSLSLVLPCLLPLTRLLPLNSYEANPFVLNSKVSFFFPSFSPSFSLSLLFFLTRFLRVRQFSARTKSTQPLRHTGNKNYQLELNTPTRVPFILISIIKRKSGAQTG